MYRSGVVCVVLVAGLSLAACEAGGPPTRPSAVTELDGSTGLTVKPGLPQPVDGVTAVVIDQGQLDVANDHPEDGTVELYGSKRAFAWTGMVPTHLGAPGRSPLDERCAATRDGDYDGGRGMLDCVPGAWLTLEASWFSDEGLESTRPTIAGVPYEANWNGNDARGNNISGAMHFNATVRLAPKTGATTAHLPAVPFTFTGEVQLFSPGEDYAGEPYRHGYSLSGQGTVAVTLFWDTTFPAEDAPLGGVWGVERAVYTLKH